MARNQIDIQLEGMAEDDDYVIFHFGSDFKYSAQNTYAYKMERFRMLALWILSGIRMENGGTSRGNMPQVDENDAIKTMYAIGHGYLLCAEATQMAAEAAEVGKRLEEVKKIKSVVTATEAAEFGATLIGAAYHSIDAGKPFTAIVACDAEGNWTINHKYTADKASKAAGMLAYDSILALKKEGRREARRRLKASPKGNIEP